MTPNKKNVPATAATVNEDNEQNLRKTTPATAYLPRRGGSTRDTFATWSGDHLPQEDYYLVLLPIDVVRDMHHVGPQLVELNEECVTAQAAHHRAAAERDRKVRLNNEINVATRGADADIAYSVELLDALGTDEWTEQMERDARDYLKEFLDRDVDEVTAELLAEFRRVRRAQRDARLAELEQEAGQ